MAQTYHRRTVVIERARRIDGVWTRQKADVAINIELDVDRIATVLAYKAASNKSRKSRQLSGLVKGEITHPLQWRNAG